MSSVPSVCLAFFSSLNDENFLESAEWLPGLRWVQYVHSKLCMSSCAQANVNIKYLLTTSQEQVERRGVLISKQMSIIKNYMYVILLYNCSSLLSSFSCCLHDLFQGERLAEVPLESHMLVNNWHNLSSMITLTVSLPVMKAVVGLSSLLNSLSKLSESMTSTTSGLVSGDPWKQSKLNDELFDVEWHHLGHTPVSILEVHDIAGITELEMKDCIDLLDYLGAGYSLDPVKHLIHWWIRSHLTTKQCIITWGTVLYIGLSDTAEDAEAE